MMKVHIYESAFGAIPVKEFTYDSTKGWHWVDVAGCNNPCCCPPPGWEEFRALKSITTLDGRVWTETELNDAAEDCCVRGENLEEYFGNNRKARP